MTHQTWRPGSENEPHGATLFRTSVRPISPAENGTHSVEAGYRMDDGSVRPIEVLDVAVLPPATAEQCGEFTQTFRGFLESAR